MNIYMFFFQNLNILCFFLVDQFFPGSGPVHIFEVDQFGSDNTTVDTLKIGFCEASF
jgi:hypothetical protein